MTKSIVIIDGVPNQLGWMPVKYLTELTADLFEADYVSLAPASRARIDKLKTLFAKRTKNRLKPDALFIVPTMAHFWSLYMDDDWKHAFNRVFLWLIDSFHTEDIPRCINRSHIDGIFITTGPADQIIYRQRVNSETTIVPWGADVLLRGSNSVDRNIDVLRLGRQPDTWLDDNKNAAAFLKRDIRYQGRPPRNENALHENNLLVQSYLKRSKYVLAQSNLVDSTRYTHKTKEYLTGRWTDSLACGCIVAGVQPRTDHAFQNCLWPEAVIEFESTDLDHGIGRIAEALQEWTPRKAQLNYLRSLEKLDWRWRLEQIAGAIDLHFPRLDNNIVQLKQKIAETHQLLFSE